MEQYPYEPMLRRCGWGTVLIWKIGRDSRFLYGSVMESGRKELAVNNENSSIIFLNPVFKRMIWGGDRFGKDFPYEIPGHDTGECWTVSAHSNGDCVVKQGVYEGMPLSRLWMEHPELFGNLSKDRFPLLVKMIDAKTDLSIQVHPDDAYAHIHEHGSLGKTECWYILDCEQDSKLVIGHNAGSKEDLRRMIEENEWNELIREIPVQKGDFLQIEPGTIHAIKGGLLILETQENSDITYRVYDYDRITNGKPRELHIEKSIDVITVPAKPAADSVQSTGDLEPNRKNLLIACDYYKVWKMDVTEPVTFPQDEPFLICSVVEGDGQLNGQLIKKGDSFILPFGYGAVSVEGNMQLIMSTV